MNLSKRGFQVSIFFSFSGKKERSVLGRTHAGTHGGPMLGRVCVWGAGGMIARTGGGQIDSFVVFVPFSVFV